jgi:L-xylulokinase
LTGGASRNPALAQMFADALDMPVTVAPVDEAAAFGAALCAGAAIGTFASPQEGARLTISPGRVYEPDAGSSAIYDRRYSVYTGIAEALKPQWSRLEGLAGASEGTA